MNLPESTIRQIVSVLEEMNILYMIGGSVALAVWAVPRTTHDLDVVVDLPEERIPEFCARFSTDRYFIDPEAMQGAFERRDQPGLGMYSFVDMETGFKVDLFPLRPGDKVQQSALNRRIEVQVLEGQRAYVYAPDDLLVQKLHWYASSDSERQFRDCLNLVLTDLERPAPLIAWDYVDQWANRLGPHIEQAWNEVKSAAKRANRGENHKQT